MTSEARPSGPRLTRGVAFVAAISAVGALVQGLFTPQQYLPFEDPAQARLWEGLIAVIVVALGCLREVQSRRGQKGPPRMGPVLMQLAGLAAAVGVFFAITYGLVPLAFGWTAVPLLVALFQFGRVAEMLGFQLS